VKLSVIIPIYNVEKYLSKCLDSVINQTYEDIEIICVNDCSQDGSLTILQEYAKQNKKIKIIDLPYNQGVSAARNIGIDAANGDFIAFLDPDDWWEVNLLEKAVTKLNADNSDIVLFGHYFFKNGKIIPDKLKEEKIEKVLNGDNYKEYLCDFVNLVWDKIYKTSFIKNHNIKFPLKIHPTEDVLYALECFSYNPKISFLSEYLYNYRLGRDGSAMNKHSLLVANAITALKQMLKSNYYKTGNIDFKEKCLEKILDGIVYFQLNAMKMKCSANNFSIIGDAIMYMQENISDELLNNNRGYKILNNLMKIHKK